MQKLLSIVIPVYNVEQYIDKCLSSLLVAAEQLQLLDVVVVNDGTPDHSAEIARQYEKSHPDVFRVIDQENRGHGGAWNHGTELAIGKYLYYLDSDDWFDTAELSKLIDFLGNCETDMVMLDGKKYFASTDTYVNTHRHRDLAPNKIYNADEFDWIATGHGYEMTYACDTVYRTKMMQQYLPLYCEHVMYDDVSLQAIPIAIAKDFMYVPLNIYRYYIGRPGQSFDPKVRAIRSADDVTKVLAFLLEWVRNHRDVVPKGGTREAYTEYNYQTMATWHYRELSMFDISIARPRLAAWNEYIRVNYPEIQPDSLVRRYRSWPFVVYYVSFHIQHFAERCIRYVRRKCKLQK